MSVTVGGARGMLCAMSLLHAVPLLLLAVAGPASLAASSDRDEVTFRVTAPDGRGPLYLTGSFQGWRPDDGSWELVPLEGEGASLWGLTVPRARLGSPPIECKLTRGSWSTVEIAADGEDVPNRILRAQDMDQRIELVVAAWADDREGGSVRASTVTGHLDVFDLASEQLGNVRKLRVWLPPGYDAPENAKRSYPVLYMNDGQNLFDAATSFQGVEWGMDEAMTALIAAGTVAPRIVVGIDNIGATRRSDYNPPYTRSEGRPHRGDDYLDFLVETVMPEIAKRYRVASGAEHTAFGGSSYGGSITLYAALRHPKLFSALLVESPAAWSLGGELLERCAEHRKWPQRVFVAVGTAENANPEFQAGYLRTAEVLQETFRKVRMGPDRARVRVVEGAPHHESAWAARLPEALAFLFGKP